MGSDLRELESKVRTLEKHVEFLMRVNGFHLSAMRNISDESLLRLYQDAAQLVAIMNKNVPLEVIERWSEHFLQLSELELTRLQPIVEFDHTWEPFYLLCMKMMTQLRTNPDMPTSLRIQQLYALLEKGRANLRDSAIMMCKKYRSTLTAQGRVLIGEGDLLTIMTDSKEAKRVGK